MWIIIEKVVQYVNGTKKLNMYIAKNKSRKEKRKYNTLKIIYCKLKNMKYFQYVSIQRDNHLRRIWNLFGEHSRVFKSIAQFCEVARCILIYSFWILLI